MSVLPFPGHNLNDIPAMLRVLADQIGGGEYGEARGLVYAFITDNDDVYTNCLGRISALESCGLLVMAQDMVLASTGADDVD